MMTDTIEILNTVTIYFLKIFIFFIDFTIILYKKYTYSYD
jgi:hypothetical protein